MTRELRNLIKSQATGALTLALLHVPPEGKTIELASGDKIRVTPV